MTTNDRGTIQRDKVYVYAACELCSVGTEVLVYDRGGQLLCAEHTRAYAVANPPAPICDRCQREAAIVRDPTHRRNEYLCLQCHKSDGFTINSSVTGKAVRTMLSPMKTIIAEKTKCEAAGYGSDCDQNVKPRGPWGGKMLCNTHGKIPPTGKSKK